MFYSKVVKSHTLWIFIFFLEDEQFFQYIFQQPKVKQEQKKIINLEIRSFQFLH